MSNQDHRMGYAPAAIDVFRDFPAYFTPAYPLGMPKRVADEIQVLEGKLAAKHLPPPFDPTAQLYMTASDTPGVLLAADPVEIRRSLDRIETALGAEKAYAARDALRARAVREAYPWHVAAIDAWTYDRKAKAEKATLECQQYRGKTATEKAALESLLYRKTATEAIEQEQRLLRQRLAQDKQQASQPSAEALKAIQLCEAQRKQPGGGAVAADIRQQGEYGLLQRMATVQSKLENLRAQQQPGPSAIGAAAAAGALGGLTIARGTNAPDTLAQLYGCNVDK